MKEVAAPVSHKPTAGMPDTLADSTKVKGESGCVCNCCTPLGNAADAITSTYVLLVKSLVVLHKPSRVYHYHTQCHQTIPIETVPNLRNVLV
jgi:hypothetical protein